MRRERHRGGGGGGGGGRRPTANTKKKSRTTSREPSGKPITRHGHNGDTLQTYHALVAPLQHPPPQQRRRDHHQHFHHQHRLLFPCSCPCLYPPCPTASSKNSRAQALPHRPSAQPIAVAVAASHAPCSVMAARDVVVVVAQSPQPPQPAEPVPPAPPPVVPETRRDPTSLR